MTRRLVVVGLAALLGVAGLALAVEGLRIPAKAAVAQILLRRSWAAARAGQVEARPWPWADTWPVARLTAPRHGVDLVVLAGANGGSLAFAPAHLTGTAPPGAPGTSFIAGHRDTHFEFLRHLRPGDRLVLETPGGEALAYRVVGLSIVDTREPLFTEDSSTQVQPASRAQSNLALVTCFPFDTPIPGGPFRYLVTAARDT